LIQNETIQFINVAYPQLKYNQDKCKRDVGYIIDAISTDLLYGGIERSVIAGKYYYEYPSQATKTQRIETSGGIRYSKIISDFIVQNIILETPRIITNDEKLIKVVSGNNSVTSSFSGSVVEQNSISSSFAIIEGIINLILPCNVIIEKLKSPCKTVAVNMPKTRYSLLFFTSQKEIAIA
jgi:hypothetical protein